MLIYVLFKSFNCACTTQYTNNPKLKRASFPLYPKYIMGYEYEINSHISKRLSKLEVYTYIIAFYSIGITTV